MEQIANLLAIARDGERLTRRDGFRFDSLATKPTYPALIVRGELTATIDCGMTENNGVEAESPCVIEHVLVGGSLRATIGSVKFNGDRFVDAIFCSAWLVTGFGFDQIEIFEIAVELIARCIDDSGPRCVLGGGFDHVART